VYREADRLGLGRNAAALVALRAELEAGLAADGRPGLVVNDLQPAALSLCPKIQDALDAVHEAGIEQALVCGSGPTVIGLAWGSDALAQAQTAAERLLTRYPSTVAVQPVRRGDAAPAANR
jgi:4-diphosphocytidyl-2-C-methyl-D-erythritol kinase